MLKKALMLAENNFGDSKRIEKRNLTKAFLFKAVLTITHFSARIRNFEIELK